MEKLSWLVDYARKVGATAADAISIATTDISASQRLGKPEGIERSESMAVGLRVFVGQGQSQVSSTDISEDTLRELAERAVAVARSAPADPDSTFAPADCLCASPPALDLCEEEEPELSWLREQCAAAEDAARHTPGITNSEGADASYSKSRISLAILPPEGPLWSGSYKSSYHSLSVSVLAGEGTGMERDYEFTGARHRSDLEAAQHIGAEAARRALARLNPRKVASCKVPVIFDPRNSRSLLNILSGAISGSSITRGASFLKDALDKPVFAPHVTITDDPHRLRGFASKPFDGEGVAGQKRNLIDGGRLTSWLLDMRSANKLGLATTGHASRGIASPPSPSATNLYMQPGTASPAELMADITSGLYLTETFGMGINIVTGDYSQGAAGFWIENGQIAYPVSEITIAGHLRDMFAQATPANDLTFRYTANAPTVRIDGMTVAGT